MNPRFTMDGSDALERHLAATCERVAEGVRALVPAAKLEGVLLGGGYGRGEGGVLRTAQGDRPYNDLEFYVLIRGCSFLNERRHVHPLHELGEKLSPDARLEVEFKILSLRKLRSSPVNMFYYDLVMGHRWFGGDDSLLAGCEHHRDAARIPLDEATRLMMNRCSGLLFAAERLQRANFTDDDADFVRRNLAKAQLGFGDAVLAAGGQYHWSCRERKARLQALQATGAAAWMDPVRRHHAAGVDFKLHPVRSCDSREDLRQRHQEMTRLAELIWLWLENRRLRASFASVGDYALSEANKCPEASPLRNRLVTAKAFGMTAALSPLGGRYPRERLLESLALLLWGGALDDTARQRLRRNLDADPNNFAGWVEAYDGLWRRFN